MSVLDYSRSASDRLSVRASFVAFQVSDGGKSWPAAGGLRRITVTMVWLGKVDQNKIMNCVWIAVPVAPAR